MIKNIYKEMERGIDYLTVRIPSSILLDRAKSLIYLGEPYRIIGFPFILKVTKDCPNNQYFRCVRILDLNGNKLGQVKIRHECDNVDVCHFDEISLQGAFWMGYGKTTNLKEFFADWNIDIFANRGASRIDFRFDLLEASQKIWNNNFYMYEKEIKKRQDNRITTWMGNKTERVQVVAYDKKLDIMDNIEKKNFYDVDGRKVYEDYEKINGPITRVEYRKSAKNLRESQRTIAEELAYVELDAIEYIGDRFGIELEKKEGMKREYKKQCGLSNSQVRQERMNHKKESEKISHAIMMIEAYAKTLDMYGGGKKLVDFLDNRYGVDLIKKLHDKQFERIFRDENNNLIRNNENASLFI